MKCNIPDLQIMKLVQDLAMKEKFLGNEIRWV